MTHKYMMGCGLLALVAVACGDDGTAPGGEGVGTGAVSAGGATGDGGDAAGGADPVPGDPGGRAPGGADAGGRITGGGNTGGADSLGGSGPGGAGVGGDTMGGASMGGSTANGGSGGSMAAGGSTGEVVLAQPFTFIAPFNIAPKSALIPGATATIVADPAASNGSALSLTVPGNASFGADDYNGPGAHAIEVTTPDRHHFGRYVVRARFAQCAASEELVNGIFTYFNDGSDSDSDGIGDNSEIDIEVLCGAPYNLWLTVWTDYEDGTFRKSTRVIDMRSGAAQDTPLGTGSYGGLAAAGTVPGVAIADFPDPGAYYTLGFDWQPDSVRYFIILDGIERELWTLTGSDYVPQPAAYFMLNLWHTNAHWHDGMTADFPSGDATLFVDEVTISTLD